jgi:hypothetical protein
MLILMTEHVCLHQYIDAMTIYRVYNFQIIFRGFFTLFAACHLITQYDLVRQLAMHIIREKK